VDKDFESASSAGAAPLEQVKQTIHSDLEYVSIQVESRTYGGWYRLLPDGQMELLALANMHCERRPENTPLEQARGMLADFIRVARPKQRRNGASVDDSNAEDGQCCATGTLGALLYADVTKTRVSEEDWVALLQSIAAADRLALRELYERTHRVVFTLMLQLTDGRETAEELTLDVFHDVWRRAPTYDSAGGSVVGWIMNQARSRAIDRLRFEQRKKRVNHHGDDATQAAATSDPHEISDLKEQGRLLREALTLLRPEEQQVIEAAFFAELTYDEVATRLNQPLGTVKTRVRAGLLKLRQALAKTVKEP
jgi:RNA polymerase sigma-70 factor (ECF subfamily)